MLLQILSTLLDKNSNSHYLITKVIPQEYVTTRQCRRTGIIFLLQNLSVQLCVKILRRIENYLLQILHFIKPLEQQKFP